MIFKKTFRTKKKKKKVIDKPIEKKEKKKTKKILKKLFNWIKEHFDKKDIIKTFVLIVIGYGLIINYSIHFIFGIKFNLLTFPAWGIAYYFIKDEFVEWFRRLIAKR